MGKKSTKLGVASLIAVGAGIAAVAAKSKKTEEKKRVKEIQKEEHDTFRNTERGKYTKNSKGIYYSNGNYCLLYTSPSPRDCEASRMPSSA